MSEMIPSSVSNLLPLPALAIRVRAATLDDLPFMDSLQKKHSKQVGWMPTATLEGKIKLGHVLIAEEGQGARGEGQADTQAVSSLAPDPSPLAPAAQRLGYCIGNDQYFKRDDVGIIYQMNVVPGRQRGLIGATLLKAQFERSAYGCRLYCCWCAQDIAANRFWEAMGFTALAFRTGSPTRGDKGTPRMHIFWQRRIRAGDTTTPWWYPSKTGGGSIREDRLVLPIMPGTHWSEAKPIVLPGAEPMPAGEAPRRSPRRSKTIAKPIAPPPPKPISRLRALSFTPPKPVAAPVAPPVVVQRQRRAEPRELAKTTTRKNDPRLVAAARELRDRWLESVNAQPTMMISAGKYDVSRDEPRRTILPNAERTVIASLPAA